MAVQRTQKAGKRKSDGSIIVLFFFPVRPHTKLLWKLSFLGLKIIVTFGGIFFPASELDLNLFYAINDLITKFTEMSHV